MALMPVSSLQSVSRSFLGFGFLLLAAAQLAVAQPVKNQHNIHVFAPADAAEQEQMCFYRIDQQSDQDVLRIAPRGTVRFYTERGLWVDIEVQDDDQGRGGTRGNGRANLRRGRPVAQLTVRNAIGANTEHKISINCCLGRSPNSCTDNWVEAQPYRQDLGVRDINEEVWVDATPQASPHGPRATDENRSMPIPSRLPHPMPGGGPMMEIDEEF